MAVSTCVPRALCPRFYAHAPVRDIARRGASRDRRQKQGLGATFGCAGAAEAIFIGAAQRFRSRAALRGNRLGGPPVCAARGPQGQNIRGTLRFLPKALAWCRFGRDGRFDMRSKGAVPSFLRAGFGARFRAAGRLPRQAPKARSWRLFRLRERCWSDFDRGCAAFSIACSAPRSVTLADRFFAQRVVCRGLGCPRQVCRGGLGSRVRTALLRNMNFDAYLLKQTQQGPANRGPTPICLSKPNRGPTPICLSRPNRGPTPICLSRPNRGPTPICLSRPNRGPTPICLSKPNRGPTPICLSKPNRGPTPICLSRPNRGPTPICLSRPNRGPTPVCLSKPNRSPTPICLSKPNKGPDAYLLKQTQQRPDAYLLKQTQ